MNLTLSEIQKTGLCKCKYLVQKCCHIPQEDKDYLSETHIHQLLHCTSRALDSTLELMFYPHTPSVSYNFGNGEM